jgi:GNAT superfamily N-acetyltransferase
VPTIRPATTPEQIARCFPVVTQLRPHLTEAGFIAQVQRQQRDGYVLAFLTDRKLIKAAAGFRFLESLSWGKYMYVDDLITAEKFRSQGHGQKLLDWLVRRAKAKGCDQFHLDSGVHRFGAHRFYLMKRLDIIAHHFAMKLR